MGWRLEDLPENIRRQALSQLVSAPVAKPDVDLKPNPAERRLEVKELHRPFQQWLALHQLPFIYPRSDKASGIKAGWPDFTVLHEGRVLCLEFKWRGQKLRPEQEEVHADLRRANVPTATVYSVVEAIDLVKERLLDLGARG